MDIILRHVKGYGWLPIIMLHDKEVYRGEFRLTPQEALESADEWAMDHG